MVKSKPTILALDTSTDACSVALLHNENVSEEFTAGIRHSDIILSMIEKVLGEAGVSVSQLDCIAFGRGPGMFTGLRIGAGVVQGVAFASDTPVIPVSSLAILAQGQDTKKIMVAVDARMNQVYWGLFVKNEQGLVQPQMEELVVAPTNVTIPGTEGWMGAGSGWDRYHKMLTEATNDKISGWQAGQYPRASAALFLALDRFQSGDFLAATKAIPVYVRDNVARKHSGEF